MKAVVLLSGGIDSTTCLAYAVSRYGADEVTALTLHYGQKHSKELQCAMKIVGHYGVRWMQQDLGEVFALSDSPLLASSGKEIPHGSYADDVTREEDGMSKTYVPFRNGLMLSYAAAVAYSLGAEKIYYGAHADDAAGNAYPDCSEEFYSAMNDAVYFGTGKKVDLIAPLIDLNKAQVVAEGIRYGAPYELTWSCYEGGDKACGKCGTCVDRIRAFESNDMMDPIEYE